MAEVPRARSRTARRRDQDLLRLAVSARELLRAGSVEDILRSGCWAPRRGTGRGRARAASATATAMADRAQRRVDLRLTSTPPARRRAGDGERRRRADEREPRTTPRAPTADVHLRASARARRRLTVRGGLAGSGREARAREPASMHGRSAEPSRPARYDANAPARASGRRPDGDRHARPRPAPRPLERRTGFDPAARHDRRADSPVGGWGRLGAGRAGRNVSGST